MLHPAGHDSQMQQGFIVKYLESRRGRLSSQPDVMRRHLLEAGHCIQILQCNLIG